MHWITDEEWSTNVLNCSNLVLVLFSAKESSVCKSEFIALEKWKLESDKEMNIYFLDVYTSPIIALNYRISILPTLIIYKSGNKIFEQICKVDFAKLEEFTFSLLESGVAK